MTDPDALDLAYRLFDLARDGAPELLGYLDAGATANLTDAAGNSLLMLAAYHGHAALVTGLADRGADVNIINDRGQTPLAGAIFKDTADVVRALVAAGADPELGQPSARESAAFFQRSELMPLLDGGP
jgi:ankyrin repeat protein